MGRPPPAPVVVGRDRELELLRSALRRAESGVPQVVIIDGDAGTGKTALISHFLDVEALPAARWASCDHFESDVAFAAVELLLGDLRNPVSDVEVGRSLLAWFSELQDQVGRAGVLVIDDAQWADRQSVFALRFALRRLRADAILTVVGRRPPLGPDPWLGLKTGRVTPTEIALPPLNSSAVAELVRQIHGWSVDGSTADHLAGRTGGVPLLLSAVVRDARAPADLTSARLPGSAADAAAQLMASLDPDARSLLEAVAVLAEPTDVVAAGQVAGIPAPSAALAPCLRIGLVTQRATQLECTHALLRDAVVAAVAPERRRTLHARAAMWTSGERCLNHRFAAAERPDPTLAADLLAAADAARRGGRFRVSVAHTMQARTVTADQGERDEFLLSALVDALRADDPVTARELAAEADSLPDSASRSFALGMLALHDGRAEPAKQLLARAAGQAAAEHRDELRSRASLALAEVHLSLNDAGAAIAATADADGNVDDETRHDLITLRALGHWQQGDVQGGLDLLDACRDGTGAARWEPDLLAARGMIRTFSGDLAAALDDLDAALALGHLWRPTQNYARALVQRASTRYFTGDWDGASVDAAAARAISDAPTHAWARPMAEAVSSHVPANRGQRDVALHHLDRARTGLTGVHSTLVIGAIVAGQVMLATADEDHAAVADTLRPLLSDVAMRRLGPARSFRWVLTNWIAANIQLGELDEAATSLGTYASLLERWPGGPMAPRLYWLRAQLAEAQNDPGAARQHYLDELADPALTRTPFLHAQVLHSAGRLDRAVGRRREAVDKLNDALSIFHRLRADPFAQRCAADLSACGLPSAPPTSPHGSPAALALTEREEDVVALVARGYTNKEVAGELFVTAKTVEYHLRNVYAKLGLANRRELRRLRAP